MISLLAGCTVRDVGTCDSNHKCVSTSLPYCDISTGRCLAGPPGDGGLDLSVGDLSMPDSGGERDAADASVDMAHCSSYSDCIDPAAPICGAAMSCRACNAATDDTECMQHSSSTPHCKVSGTNAGKCVACAAATQATDCSGTTPICGDDGACRKCAAHTECSTGVCKPDGSCAMLSEIAYVDNGGIAVGDCNANGAIHNGGPNSAYCDIQDGVSTTKPYVKVIGHSGAVATYGQVSITSARTVSIYGPGVGATQPARILSTLTASPNVNISIGSGTSTIVFDGIEIGDRTTSNSQDGVYCSTTATVSLSVLRGAIQHSGKIGLESSGCNVTLDGDNVTANLGGGLAFSSGGYTVLNTFIVQNLSTTGPAVLIASATGTFQFNTVADNSYTGHAGGASCGSGDGKMLESSIFWNNGVGGEFAGNCIYSYVNSESALSGLGNFTGDPKFIGSGDYRLGSGSSCVDKVSSTVDGGAAMLPDHDFYGTHRPLGSAWDVGAQEAR
jgi:hypothetical protein